MQLHALSFNQSGDSKEIAYFFHNWIVGFSNNKKRARFFKCKESKILESTESQRFQEAEKKREATRASEYSNDKKKSPLHAHKPLTGQGIFNLCPRRSLHDSLTWPHLQRRSCQSWHPYGRRWGTKRGTRRATHADPTLARA